MVDEQHRFGVEQRDALRQKGYNPHMLVMTATPIPRTLALTLYGDLDVSTLDEMPAGRQPIITRWRSGTQRQEAYRLVAQEVAEGRQAYIICPLVEESEKLEAKAGDEEYERLRTQVFPDLRLGLVHGQMRPAREGSRDARLPRWRDRRAGGDGGGRGRRGRAERDGDADRGRRALRPLAVAPVPWAGRARRSTSHIATC